MIVLQTAIRMSVSFNQHNVQLFVLPEKAPRFIGSSSQAGIIDRFIFTDKLQFIETECPNQVLLGFDYSDHRISCLILAMATLSDS
jgi:hypothetical protein